MAAKKKVTEDPDSKGGRNICRISLKKRASTDMPSPHKKGMQPGAGGSKLCGHVSPGKDVRWEKSGLEDFLKVGDERRGERGPSIIGDRPFCIQNVSACYGIQAGGRGGRASDGYHPFVETVTEEREGRPAPPKTAQPLKKTAKRQRRSTPKEKGRNACSDDREKRD